MPRPCQSFTLIANVQCMHPETITTRTGGENDPATRAAIKVKLAEAVAICRAALAEPEMAGLAQRLPEGPADAKQWFELLGNFSGTKETAAMARMKNILKSEGAAGLASLEHYAVLQALTVSLPRVIDLPLAASVKLECAELAKKAARPNDYWRRNFAATRMPHVRHMAELATLRQFPAGELIFDFCKPLHLAWPLRFPPRALPGFLLEVAFGILKDGDQPYGPISIFGGPIRCFCAKSRSSALYGGWRKRLNTGRM